MRVCLAIMSAIVVFAPYTTPLFACVHGVTSRSTEYRRKIMDPWAILRGLRDFVASARSLKALASGARSCVGGWCREVSKRYCGATRTPL